MITNLINSDTPVSVLLSISDLEQFAITIANKVVSALSDARQSENPITWLTAEQVCERLNIDRSTLWRWGKEGYLSPTKFGNRNRYNEAEVLRVEAAEKKGGIR